MSDRQWEPPRGEENENENKALAPQGVAARRERERVFNIPGPLLSLLLFMGVIFAIQNWITSDEIAEWITLEFGFLPSRYTFPLAEQDLAWLWSPVTYSLLHGNVQHYLFNAVALAAFGTPVFLRIGLLRFMAMWLVCAAGGAAVHAALFWQDQTVLVGASGVISGVMGGLCRFALGAEFREPWFREERFLVPRMTVITSLRRRTVVSFAFAYLLLNSLVAFGINLLGGESGAIAWDVHIAGFLIGFLGFALFDRSGASGASHS
ncbi:rhomboid family intramembrane serine protease [Allorhizobium undicola]|uniref:rhomboid family intramembrane serine protease n=1 Tax=Allorhizobium undicola TaxID=78527 RepID=UPI003D32A11C